MRLGNILSGALSGGTVGSFFGPIGTGLGALLGGVGGLSGSGRRNADELRQYQKYTPQQQAYRNNMLSQVQGLTPSGFDYLRGILSNDPSAFEDYEAPAMQQFQEEIIPSILERFSGMGARSSSALNQTLGRAGQTLSTNLNAQRQQARQNALEQLMRLAGVGLEEQTTPYIYKTPTTGFNQLLEGGGDLLFDILRRKISGS